MIYQPNNISDEILSEAEFLRSLVSLFNGADYFTRSEAALYFLEFLKLHINKNNPIRG